MTQGVNHVNEEARIAFKIWKILSIEDCDNLEKKDPWKNGLDGNASSQFYLVK